MKKLLVTLMVALFATVVLAQTKIEIKPADLPKCVGEWVKQNMKGFTIERAFKLETKGEISYLVEIVKGKEKRILEFDRNCKNVKKIAPEKNPFVSPTPPKPVPVPKDEEKKDATPKK